MLTEREVEILKLRKEGKTQAEIAQKLKISQPAVSSFERNARKKIADAQNLLEVLKKLGLILFAVCWLPFLAQSVNATTPNPGHDASRIGPGTFSSGNFTFTNSLTVNGSLLFIDSQNSMVGIGTLTPNATLDVNGSVRVTNSTNGTIFIIKTFSNGTARVGINVENPQNALSVNGTINASGQVNPGAGLDISEQFTMTEPMSPGDIVAIVNADSVKRATAADASLVIGVYSTSPGIVLSKASLPNTAPIAINGRVPVKIATPVKQGDYITVSDTPGVGISATEPSFVVGRALEDSASGTVMVLINPGYFSPRVDSTGTLIGGLATQKFEPPADEKLGDAVVVDTTGAPVTNAQQITTQDASVSGTLETNIITPEQGKDVVVVLG